MLNLILFLIVGSILAYLSQFNFTPVSVNLGVYIFYDVPLFFVMIGSLVTGLLLSYLFHIAHMISNSFVLRGKAKELKKNKDEVLELTKRIHQLEIENEKLKQNSPTEPIDPFAL